MSCYMGKSLEDQLLALGLVDKKKVSKSKKQQHQQKKQKAKSGKNQPVVDENVLLAKKAEEKKKERARKLNQQRDAKLQKRADEARLKQLVEQHRLEKDEKGAAYRFNVAGKIQRIYVSNEITDKLSDGRLGIIGMGKQFEVVPRAIAEKIQEISDRVYVNINAPTTKQSTDPEDPYADYEIPDDLMW